MKKETILLVDDVEINLKILRKLLGDKYNLMCANDGDISIEIVKNNKIDLILLDIMMPKVDGYKVSKFLQSNEETKDIPIIFVTSKTDEESIVKGYEMGARDYVTKPYKKMELLARIKTQLETHKLIKDLKFLANHDTMTGVYNRRKFFELAEKRFKEYKNNLYVVMIDIDKFKNINDTYGHQTGDRVLKEFANIVKNYIQEDTIFGRIGGEEFVLICNFKDENKLKKRLEILRKAIERSEVVSFGKKVNFTISIGVAKASSNHHNIDDMLREADENLYEAKGTGRNKVIFRKRREI
jgi:diguanylate cyclase (GGDEF)-like protein